MTKRRTSFVPVSLSLADILGKEFADRVVEARAALSGEDRATVAALADEPVDFFPAAFQDRLLALLPRVGRRICAPRSGSAADGATTRAFAAATRVERAPLSGYGWYRVGEDGRLYLASKSAHYHAPLGHSFPGYRLVENARRLGIPSATHNNNRGFVTRLLEEELVRAANRLEEGDAAGFARVMESEDPETINRVLNLVTGSVAAEAALKLILARFYRSEKNDPPPPYEGRTPVVLVMGDDTGGPTGNYHGTTFLTQAMRGMWPDFRNRLEAAGLFQVCAVRPNELGDVEAAFAKYDRGRTKIAAFFHEIVMMNYGGRRLTADFLRSVYDLCRAHDVPTVVDEIQSCLWAPEFFLYHEYGLKPSFVVVGKGFPGGEYAASRLLFSAVFDRLPQFGALVTNGQEELASLSYLVTMRWARANAQATRAVGAYYEERLRSFAASFPDRIAGIDGAGHLSTIRFHELSQAKAFAAGLAERGLDVSVQTYKADCPPVVLMKLPLIAGYELVDFVLEQMDAVTHG